MKLHLLTQDTAATEPPGDSAFLRSLGSGSVEAMAIFYDRNHERVRVLARRLLGDDAAAEDVVQEVFAAFPRAVRRYRGDCDLEGFLLAVAVKKARSHLRSTIRRRRLLERYGREERPGPRDPEQDAYRKDLVRRL
jgi:RNA polymerase sigma-70 factor (ECF subfamily)